MNVCRPWPNEIRKSEENSNSVQGESGNNGDCVNMRLFYLFCFVLFHVLLVEDLLIWVLAVMILYV